MLKAVDLICDVPMISGFYVGNKLYTHYEAWFWNPQAVSFPDLGLTPDVVQRHFDAIYH